MFSHQGDETVVDNIFRGLDVLKIGVGQHHKLSSLPVKSVNGIILFPFHVHFSVAAHIYNVPKPGYKQYDY